MIFVILLVLAVGFVGYAVFTQYTHTDVSQDVPKRVWLSVVAAGSAIGAFVVQWLHTATGP